MKNKDYYIKKWLDICKSVLGVDGSAVIPMCISDIWDAWNERHNRACEILEGSRLVEIERHANESLYAPIMTIGTDIIELPRIANVYNKYGLMGFRSVFTEQEYEYLKQLPETFIIERIAGRIAAKEAIFKTLKINSHMPWQSCEILVDENNIPKAVVTPIPVTIRNNKKYVSFNLDISISHSENTATAVAIHQFHYQEDDHDRS